MIALCVFVREGGRGEMEEEEEGRERREGGREGEEGEKEEKEKRKGGRGGRSYLSCAQTATFTYCCRNCFSSVFLSKSFPRKVSAI